MTHSARSGLSQGSISVLMLCLSLGNTFFLVDSAFSGGRYQADPWGYRRSSGYPSRAYDHHPPHMARAPPRCPPYRAMDVQRSWAKDVDGSHILQATLPGVDAKNRHVRLNGDGSLLEFIAARALPAAGRVCLPRDAHVSTDGRYEILKTAVGIPSGGDINRMSMRHTSDGVEIKLPALVVAPPKASTNVRGAAPKRSVKHTAVDTPTEAVAPLPYPSHGVEVVEEQYHWPEKLPDAAEGFYDNRGDFHYY